MPTTDPEAVVATLSSHTFGVDLAIVPINRVLPHEVPDESRTQRLSHRLIQDGILRDPIMVARVRDVDGLVLLDGTNRRAALHEAGYANVLAQIVDYEDRHCVHLLTWSHLVDTPLALFRHELASMPGIEFEDVPQESSDEFLEQPGVLAAVSAGSESWVIRKSGKSGTRPELLRTIVSMYERRMRREARDKETVAEKLEEVRSRPGGQEATLVTFPRITRHQVVDLAIKGTPIPAGITRHVMRCGRALRVNVPLDWLSGAGLLADAEGRLRDHLGRLHPRRYLEPTVLFDS